MLSSYPFVYLQKGVIDFFFSLAPRQRYDIPLFYIAPLTIMYSLALLFNKVAFDGSSGRHLILIYSRIEDIYDDEIAVPVTPHNSFKITN